MRPRRPREEKPPARFTAVVVGRGFYTEYVPGEHPVGHADLVRGRYEAGVVECREYRLRHRGVAVLIVRYSNECALYIGGRQINLNLDDLPGTWRHAKRLVESGLWRGVAPRTLNTR